MFAMGRAGPTGHGLGRAWAWAGPQIWEHQRALDGPGQDFGNYLKKKVMAEDLGIKKTCEQKAYEILKSRFEELTSLGNVDHKNQDAVASDSKEEQMQMGANSSPKQKSSQSINCQECSGPLSNRTFTS